jgi:hypothetical protein
LIKSTKAETNYNAKIEQQQQTKTNSDEKYRTIGRNKNQLQFQILNSSNK